jgi:hypothetical protein
MLYMLLYLVDIGSVDIPLAASSAAFATCLDLKACK